MVVFSLAPGQAVSRKWGEMTPDFCLFCILGLNITAESQDALRLVLTFHCPRDSLNIGSQTSTCLLCPEVTTPTSSVTLTRSIRAQGGAANQTESGRGRACPALPGISGRQTDWDMKYNILSQTKNAQTKKTVKGRRSQPTSLLHFSSSSPLPRCPPHPLSFSWPVKVSDYKSR